MNLTRKNIANKSNNNCCVYGCTSVRRKNGDLTYHSFPKQGKENVAIQDDFGGVQMIDRKKAWEYKLKMGKKVSNYMRVCSLHFIKDDYYYAEWQGNRRLLPTAVPSQNLPISSQDLNKEKKKMKEARSLARSQRLENRTGKSNDAKILQMPIAETIVSEAEQVPLWENAPLEAAESLLLLSGSCSKKVETPKQFRDIGIQVNFDSKEVRDCEVQVNTSEMVTVCDFLQTDMQLNSLTGLHSFALLNTLVQFLNCIQKDIRIHRLSMYKRVLLCFMKLKLDLPYVILAILFGVSSQTCKRIFFDLIPSLARILNLVIPFPSYEKIQQNMPKCFKDYQDVRIVLDCTEIYVQKSKKLCCKIKLYSHYKGTTTIKFMTGVSPAGLITYVSPPYGGRTSDKAIFERSNLLEKLRINTDHIMVDKGFLIDDLCQSYGIKLIRPPFLRHKKQFSPEEAILNAKIAAARVHIERVNQRIKIFHILTNRLPINLVPIINDIFVIACGITNLSNPILADDKMITTE